jgi:hypothetical protein
MADFIIVTRLTDTFRNEKFVVNVDYVVNAYEYFSQKAPAETKSVLIISQENSRFRDDKESPREKIYCEQNIDELIDLLDAVGLAKLKD